MGVRRQERRRVWSWRGALLGITVALAGCAPDLEGTEEALPVAEQSLAACSYAITTNTYVGADWWGTIVFKNTGTAAMTSPTVSFGVPSGIVCDYDEPGWTHTQSGTTCTYSRTSALTGIMNTPPIRATVLR